MADKTVLDFPAITDDIDVDDILYLIRGTGTDRDKKVPGDRIRPTFLVQNTGTTIDLGTYLGDLVIRSNPGSNISLTFTNLLPNGRRLVIINNSLSTYTISLAGSVAYTNIVHPQEIIVLFSDSANMVPILKEGSPDYQCSRGGLHGHAEGILSDASGIAAHAEGYDTEASGYAAHAEGRETIASNSRGHAEGYQTQATNFQSHAEGSGTTASGQNAHAEGGSTTASGTNSHAEGSGTEANQAAAHAEGSGTLSSNTASHAEGIDTEATNVASHAEGYNSVSSGQAAHAEGTDTTASAINSHAEGNGSTAIAADAHAEGRQSNARLIAQYTHACGQFAAVGDCQFTRFILRGTSTTNVLVELTSPSRFTLEDEHSYAVTLTIHGRQDTGANHAMYKRMLIIKRTGGTVALAGSIQTIGTDIETSVPWAIAIAADDTNKSLQVQAQGGLNENVRWIAVLEVAEIAYQD